MDKLQQECEKIKEKITGKKVKYPTNNENPDRVGVVKSVYTQPAIDLGRKQSGIVFVSEDELPDLKGNYPVTELRPKILCVVRFGKTGDLPPHIQVVEYQDLDLVDDNE